MTATRPHPVRHLLSLLAAAAILHLTLIQPNHPDALTWGALRLFPLELPVILLGLAAVPHRGWPTWIVRGLLVLVLMTMVLVKLADFATFTTLNRPFNPVADMYLVGAGWNVASASVGLPRALLVLGGAAAVLALWALLLWWATGRWAGLAAPIWPRRLAAGLALVAAGVAAGEIGHILRWWHWPDRPPGAAFTARVAVERTLTWRQTLADLAVFRQAVAADPLSGQPDLLAAIAGRDVLVIFVESYGRASFDYPLYAPTHAAVIGAAQTRIAAAGLAMRTGWLTSPIEGGQSWLAHATLASGLSVPGQNQNIALLASRRRTLWQIAQTAGWRTVAVMPAITMPWPESARLGFDVLLDRDRMQYGGRPFEWVTMPDQFTLARFRDRLPPDPRPLFAQIALISSHAPWTPLPDPVPWDDVGDGTIFDPMVAAGDSPQVVWADPDRVRDQYRLAIAYSLEIVFDYAARQAGPDMPLIVVLGDHPPAAFVSQVAGRDVPLHLIGPAEVVALFDGWGFVPGLHPGPDAPVWPMERVRDRLVGALTPGLAP